MNFTSAGLPMSWEHRETMFRHRLARATGRWETLVKNQLAHSRENAPAWPELGFYMSDQAVATMARVDLREGYPERAMARAEAAFPAISRNAERMAPEVLDPLWLRVALLKQSGQAQEAEQLLRRQQAYHEKAETANEPRHVGVVQVRRPGLEWRKGRGAGRTG